MGGLRYVGKGFLAGIPARDLGEEELAELQREYPGQDLAGVLVRSGLYEREEKAGLGGREDKALRQAGRENKGVGDGN